MAHVYTIIVYAMALVAPRPRSPQRGGGSMLIWLQQRPSLIGPSRSGLSGGTIGRAGRV